MTQHPTSKRAKEKRSDADRQQCRRDDLKASGTPATHVLNRAIAEGVMYQIDLQREGRIDVKDMKLSAQNVLAYATSILTSGTNASSRYEVESVTKTIRKRIGQPDAGKFRVRFLTPEQRNAATLKAIDYGFEVDE